MEFLFISVLIAVVTSQEDCGLRKSANPLVYGGTAVSVGDFPWVVPLFRKYNDKFFCGSNLISRQHLLTAAHCVLEKRATTRLTEDDIYAYVGRFDLTQTVNEEKSQKVDIKKIVIHPNWSLNDIRYDADISILMLKRRLDFSDTIQPVCLPNPDEQVFKIRGMVVGYGRSESGTLHENIPRKVEISSYTNDDCFFADYQFARFGSPRTFCAGEKGKTPCQGDSGSGFYIDTRSTYKVLGLVSAATVQECGNNDFVLFTNVGKFTDWIHQEIRNTNDNDVLESVFNEFDENPNESGNPIERRNLVDTSCKYQESSSTYACYVNGLNAPDEDITLRIRDGQHQPERTNQDVTAMQMAFGSVTHFPDLSDVMKTFPNMNGFGIAFAKLKHIDRSKMKDLGQFRFLLISDNEIEVIPADTFMDLKDLELIDICRNKIKDLEPNWISTMPRLRVFKARSNKFQYVPGNMFKSNPQLEEILFDFNPLERIDVNFNDLKSLKNTEKASAEDDWWEYGHFYQIYPRSFQDTDGDGIGDLNGIISRLSYLKFIGVTGIWLSPIFQSPMVDFGYDISDLKKIQSEYGTMEDFEALIDRCKELDIKLILDFVPNHCSSEHEWFKKAINSSDPEHKKYKDYFIWHKGKLLENGTHVPSSNWLNIFRGSAWEWVDSMQSYYLHQFLEVQPELNFRNPSVAEEMKDVIRFWLRKGVSGFRVDAVPYIFEAEPAADGNYVDEPPSGNCIEDPLAGCYLNTTQTKDLDETYDMVYQWRKVLEEKEFAGYTKIMMSEGYTTLPNVMRYYGHIENGEIVGGKYGVQIPFNFLLQQNITLDSKAGEYKFIIDNWMSSMPKGNKIQANWVIGNHDNKRIASKHKPSRIDLFNIMLKTLPGITVTYYGEEIGMTDIWISWNDTIDPQACRTDPNRYEKVSRDPVRSPFQWDNTKNAGFSSAEKTWLPVALNYTRCNVQQQLKDLRSHFKVFNDLMKLRKNPTMKYGGFEIKAIDDELLVYKRQIADDPNADIVVVALNLETNTKTIDLRELFNGLPKQMKVVVSSIHSTFDPGAYVQTKGFVISPEDGIVLTGKYSNKLKQI